MYMYMYVYIYVYAYIYTYIHIYYTYVPIATRALNQTMDATLKVQKEKKENKVKSPDTTDKAVQTLRDPAATTSPLCTPRGTPSASKVSKVTDAWPGASMCVHVYMYICTCICYVCICLCVYMYICIYIYQ